MVVFDTIGGAIDTDQQQDFIAAADHRAVVAKMAIAAAGIMGIQDNTVGRCYDIGLAIDNTIAEVFTIVLAAGSVIPCACTGCHLDTGHRPCPAVTGCHLAKGIRYILHL